MPTIQNLKKISGVRRQDNIPSGVDNNIFARAFEVNPLLELFIDLDTKDFANDAAAAAGGVEIGELYHASGVVRIRLV